MKKISRRPAHGRRPHARRKPRSLTYAGVARFLSLAAARAPGRLMPIPGEEDEPLPSAAEILQLARDAFPEEPLVIHARLEPRDGKRDEGGSVRVTLGLRWGDTPPSAQIRLSDAFGTPLAEARVLYRAGNAEFLFSADPPPGPDDPILDTDFTWGDLALSFLWWNGGELRGFESRRGRRCYVVDLPSPAPTDQSASVRLWIDAYVHALLQAETRTAEGVPIRRLSVRSLRRVGLRWTLEDLELRDVARGTRTLLRVEDLFILDPPPDEAP